MSSDEPTDEELYERWCGSGPLLDRQAAWEELDQRYHTKLLTYCYRITRDATIPLDCVNDAFLALMGERRGISSSFRAYLWRTARNLARAALKARPKTNPSPQIADVPDPTARGISWELRDALEACLERLELDKSEFLLLHVCDGLTFEEARDVVGWTCSISTCKYRSDRALENLRACLKKTGFSLEKDSPEIL